MIYQDNTPIPFGKYKFTSIYKIPSEYLLNWLKMGGSEKADPGLFKYINDNIERIKDPSWNQNKEIKKERGLISNIVCKSGKISYVTKKVANFEMRRINKVIDENKPKLVRSYECKMCNFWHNTSSTKEEYEEKVEKHKL